MPAGHFEGCKEAGPPISLRSDLAGHLDGMPPSTRGLQAVIPFDDFATTAPALANINVAGQTANVRMSLFDCKNSQVGNAAIQTLPVNDQVPKILYLYFPGVTLAKGRVRKKFPLLLDAQNDTDCLISKRAQGQDI